MDTRRAHTTLLGGLETVESSLDHASLGRVIEIGSILHDLESRTRVVLEKIKALLRREALARTGGCSGTSLLEGEDVGEASVNVPEATLQMAKGVDVEELRRALGEDFPRLFQISLRPRKDFQQQATRVADPSRLRVLHASVERVETTPRVSFRRRKTAQR